MQKHVFVPAIDLVQRNLANDPGKYEHTASIAAVYTLTQILANTHIPRSAETLKRAPFADALSEPKK